MGSVVAAGLVAQGDITIPSAEGGCRDRVIEEGIGGTLAEVAFTVLVVEGVTCHLVEVFTQVDTMQVGLTTTQMQGVDSTVAVVVGLITVVSTIAGLTIPIRVAAVGVARQEDFHKEIMLCRGKSDFVMLKKYAVQMFLSVFCFIHGIVLT